MFSSVKNKYIYNFIYSEGLRGAIQSISVYDGFPSWLYQFWWLSHSLWSLSLTISSKELVLSLALLSTIYVSGFGSTLFSIVLSLMFLRWINTNSLSNSESKLMDVGGGCGCLKRTFLLGDFSEGSWSHKNSRLRCTILILLAPFSV